MTNSGSCKARYPVWVPEPSDAELLRRWHGGDDAAGSALVSRHFPAVYRFFRRKGDDRAEDLTQRTFVACQSSLERLDQAESFRAFLLGIARNVLLQDVRSEGRRQQRHERAAREPMRSQTSPSGYAAAREEQRLLLTALRTLPVEQQLVLELHYWETLTTAEMASVLEVPQGTVKWRLTRARAALKDALEAIEVDAMLRDATVTNLDAWAESLRAMLDDD